MKRKIISLVDEYTDTDKRKTYCKMLKLVEQLYNEERGNELLWSNLHKDIKKILLSQLSIEDLVHASFVCKEWYKYMNEFLLQEYRSNIPIKSQIPHTRDYLIHFLGVGGNAWIKESGRDSYIISNTKATFRVCSLKPGVNIFYMLWAPAIRCVTRQIHLKKYEEVIVELKPTISSWRKGGHTKKHVQLLIAAQYLHMKHVISLQVIVPNANIGFKRVQRAKKNNVLIL